MPISIVLPAVMPSCTMCVPVAFPVTVTNYLVKSNLREEGLALLTFEEIVHHRGEVHHKAEVNDRGKPITEGKSIPQRKSQRRFVTEEVRHRGSPSQRKSVTEGKSVTEVKSVTEDIRHRGSLSQRRSPTHFEIHHRGEVHHKGRVYGSLISVSRPGRSTGEALSAVRPQWWTSFR